MILVESMAAYTTLRAAFGWLPDDLHDDRILGARVDLAASATGRADQAVASVA